MDSREFGQGLRMAAVAVVSAVLTASLVIGLGHSLTARRAPVGVPVVQASLN